MSAPLRTHISLARGQRGVHGQSLERGASRDAARSTRTRSSESDAAHAASGTLGILVGGILGEQFGMNAAILVGVVGGLFSFVWLWRSPIRGLDAFPHPTP
jgi:predicted MFS family arabinose efflux permease